MTYATPPGWTRPGRLEQVSGWIHACLAQEGITITGSIAPVHEQAGSTVLRVPTNNGDFYFKACTPVLSHEAAVTQALYRWRPDCIPAVLQIDARQGWLLMADGGETLRSAFRRKGTTLTKESWQEILALYADLQIDSNFDSGSIRSYKIDNDNDEIDFTLRTDTVINTSSSFTYWTNFKVK